MNTESFRKVLAAFASRQSDIDLSKGEFVLQLQDDLISGRITHRAGQLFVEEEGSGTQVMAEEWVIQRVARVDRLADRILNYVQEEKKFVTPSGRLLDTLEKSPEENEEAVPDALDKTRELLDQKLAGTSFVLYLTSDAGEGKTTLINQLARQQALLYKAKQTDWLLVPIALGGRPLLRFDDLMVGHLMNRLRFQYWYYDAVIELLKMGVIVLALDGFEEMFIETSTGEAMTNLSGLVRSLEGNGALLIAARKAYFEYHSFKDQARLVDAVDPGVVSFARIGLDRWQRQQFLDYCDKADVPNGAEIYRDISKELGDNHPLLTRAVLARRLVSVAADQSDRRSLLRTLGDQPQEFFEQFVEAIVDREAQEKWIDRSAEPAGPILSIWQHYELLSLLAAEMWTSHTDQIGDDVVSLLTELFCDDHKLSVSASRQVKDRLPDHALIEHSQQSGRSFYAFDHEQFRDFFLSSAIAEAIKKSQQSEIRRLLEAGLLSEQGLTSVAYFLTRAPDNVRRILDTLGDVARSATRDSYLSENCGGVVVRLIDGIQGCECEFRNLICPPASLSKRVLDGVIFTACTFRPTELGTLAGCLFTECTFERIELVEDTKLTGTIFEGTDVHSLLTEEAASHLFDPKRIRLCLAARGLQFPDTTEAGQEEDSSEGGPADQDLEAAQRVFRAFMRSTYVNERLLNLKLRERHDSVMSALLRGGVLEEADVLGGRPRRFRLSVRMRDIEKALEQCDGTLADFITKLPSR